MIAKIETPFNKVSFYKKVNYHEEKIEKGVAYVLASSWGDESLKNFKEDAELVAEMNNRVQGKYIEFSLNFNPGETVSDEKIREIASEYIEEMGYSNSIYAVVRHQDKRHAHVHVLCTRIDMEGKRIDDAYSHLKSQQLSRQIEKKFGLNETQYNKFNNQRLSKIKSREYFFHNGLAKGLKNYSSKDELLSLLKDVINIIDIEKSRTNIEWEIILGNDKYNEIGGVLEKKNYFNPLFKDELLKVLDENIKGTKTFSEFQKKVQEKECYMRMVSKNGVNSFVYGIPSANFYVKEKDLPKTYRYENLKKEGFTIGSMMEDYQKNYLYNVTFRSLNTSKTYEEFKDKLEQNNVGVVEHINSGGVYGLSFYVQNVENTKIFKASDISKQLSYKNIEAHLNQESTKIENIIINQDIMKDIESNVDFYNMSTEGIISLHAGMEEGLENSSKKRKRKNPSKNKD